MALLGESPKARESEDAYFLVLCDELVVVKGKKAGIRIIMMVAGKVKLLALKRAAPGVGEPLRDGDRAVFGVDGKKVSIEKKVQIGAE